MTPKAGRSAGTGRSGPGDRCRSCRSWPIWPHPPRSWPPAESPTGQALEDLGSAAIRDRDQAGSFAGQRKTGRLGRLDIYCIDPLTVDPPGDPGAEALLAFDYEPGEDGMRRYVTGRIEPGVRLLRVRKGGY